MGIKKDSRKVLTIEILRDGVPVDLPDSEWTKKLIWRKSNDTKNQTELDVSQTEPGKFDTVFEQVNTNINIGKYIAEIEATNILDITNVVVIPDDVNNKFIEFNIVKSLRKPF